MLMKFGGLLMFIAACAATNAANAAGVLTPAGGQDSVSLLSHDVKVLINNGFARTQVTQVFLNETNAPLDAIYEFPVPPDGALSELRLLVGDRLMRGEVLEAERASALYADERDAGQSAALAVQNDFFTYQFDIAQIPAQDTAELTFVYYEQLPLDGGFGRYLYPLQDGGTRTEADAFWSGEEAETDAQSFSFEVELRSAFEVEDVRLSASGSVVEQLGEGHYRAFFESTPGSLGDDLVFYYRLPADLPARAEVIPYRAGNEGLGTFMMIVTPGADLAPMPAGADYVYVLDISGSMQGKFEMMLQAVEDALALMGEGDRVRMLAFDGGVHTISEGFVDVTPANMQALLTRLRELSLGNSTNLYAGLSEGLSDVDADRVVNLVLITDGVANEGIIDPLEFQALMQEQDVRLFSMLMGNSANWPLMDIVTEASGGYYTAVSTADDIVGQTLLMRNKVLHEAFHDVELTVSGVETEQLSDFSFAKVHHGEQVVVFGRYAAGGDARLRLKAKIAGQTQVYEQEFVFPKNAPENPELERLWALEMIHAIEQQELLGLLDADQARSQIVTLGVDYQLVTNHTSMVVVSDAAFEDNDIERANQARTATEESAQAMRVSSPIRNYSAASSSPSQQRVSTSKATGSGGSGGGAFDLVSGLLGLLIALLAFVRRREVVQNAVG